MPLVFVCLFAALVILFSDFVFSDQMLFGSDILQASFMFRWYQFQYMSAHGGVPQWIAHQFGGMPFVEAFHSDIFYPPSLVKNELLILLGLTQPIDFARALGWEFLLHIFLAGLFMYFAARQFKLGKIPSLLAASAYMFAGYFVSMVAPGHDGKIYVTALFPLLMLFLDRGFERRPFLNFSLLGLVIGLILLTPHPQMSYFSLWALSFYAAFRLILLFVDRMELRRVIAPGLGVVYAVAIGVAISFIQMYPGITYTQNYSPRADTKKGWEWATSWSMHEEEAASLLVPEFSGTNSQKAKTYYWGKNFFKDNTEWLGTVPLFLALLGVAAYAKRRLAWFFFGLGTFALLYGLGGTTPFFWIMFTLVPKVESMRAPSMIMFLGSFSVALLSGMGLQALLDYVRQAGDKRDRLVRNIVIGFPGLLFVLAIGFSLAGRGMIDLWCSLFYGDAASTMVQQEVSKLDVAYLNLPSIRQGAWLAFLFTGLAALLISLHRGRKIAGGLLLAIVGIVVVDGVRFDDRFIDVVADNRWRAQYEASPLTNYLRQQPDKFRVLHLTQPNDATLPFFGIDVVVGYHGNQLRWYDDLLGGPGLTNIHAFNPRLLNLVGARYLINPTQQQFPANHFGEMPLFQVADFGGLKLLRNDNALPRVFLAGRFEVVAEREQINSLVLRGDSDLRRLVYLEEDPGLGIVAADTLRDSAWVMDYQAESVRIGVEASQNRLLVLTDTWYDAWQAWVDGAPATILRADCAFRAVAVPAGAREVRFQYHSPRYVLGKRVTYITVGYLAIVLGLLWYRGRRGGAAPVDATINE